MMKKRWFSAFLALTLLLGMACGCAASSEEDDAVPLGEIPDDVVPLAGLPPISLVLSPSATGTAVKEGKSAVVDYSNAADGYVMVKWTGGGSPKLKVQIKGPSCPDTWRSQSIRSIDATRRTPRGTSGSRSAVGVDSSSSWIAPQDSTSC